MPSKRQLLVLAVLLVAAPGALAILLWRAVGVAVRHFWGDLRAEWRDAVELYRYSPAEQCERARQRIRAGFPAPRTVTVREDTTHE